MARRAKGAGGGRGGLGVGVWDWDLHGRFQLSPQLERHLGLQPGAFAGSPDALLSLVSDDDRHRLADAFAALRRDGSRFELELRIVNGSTRWFGAYGEVLEPGPDQPPHAVGAMVELAASDVAERRMRRQQGALLELAAKRRVHTRPRDEALAIVTRTAAEVLQVARVGVWLHDPVSRALECAMLFDRRTGVTSGGPKLEASAYPVYFESIRTSRSTAIADVYRDPRTAELTADYFVPHGISATLDVAVRREGRKIGIVCHEHVGPSREWTLDEQGFAASIADIVTELIETDARRTAEAALRATEERYRAFVEHSTEAIWRVELDVPLDCSAPPAEQMAHLITHGRVVECNTPLAHTVGKTTVAEVHGQLLGPMVGDRNARALLGAWIGAGYRLVDFEASLWRPPNDTRWYSVSMTGVVEDGQLFRLWGISRDVTERRAALHVLEHQTYHDTLTGLPNRDYLADQIRGAIATSKQHGTQFGLLLIDLDHFKEVNDTLGHHVGDQMLQGIGPRLEALFEPHGQVVARLGGDEFGVLLRRLGDVGDVADRILAALREPFVVDDVRLEIGASIGSVVYPDDGADTTTLLRRADVAMYAAKRARRGHAAYSAAEDPHTPRRLTLLSELGPAIRERGIGTYYQPKVSLVNGALVGFEALSRWPHAQHGMVPPDEFVTLAEMGSLIRQLTSLSLDNAMRQWVEWATGGHRVTIAINVSARTLLDDALVDEAARALDTYEVPPPCLELEITESAFLADPQRSLTRLRRLHSLGVSLAIDDFGTGFSSLAYLQHMPLQSLKIDRSFVMGMSTNAGDRTIVTSTINLAHSLGFKVVAEGIETRAQLDALQALGCDFGQGWLFAPALEAAEARHAFDMPGWMSEGWGEPA